MIGTQTQAVRLVGASLLIIALGLGLIAAAGNGSNHGNDALVGTVNGTVEPGGEIVVLANLSASGEAIVTVTADNQINVSDNTTVSAGASLYPTRERTINTTSADFDGEGYAQDVLEIDVTGSNLTSTVNGTIEDPEVSVLVDVAQGNDTTSVVGAPVSIEDPGLFSGGLLEGTSSDKLLLGVAALLALWLIGGRGD